jgi:signal peptidase I
VKRIVAVAVTVGLLALWWVIGPRYILKTFRIPTGAMSPTVPVGSLVFVHPTNDVHLGDLTVFRHPTHPKTFYVMRTVALAGDTVQIREKKLFVNGAERNEPYAVHEDALVYPNQPALPEPYRSRDWFGPYRVPADSFFVLGDNRDRSYDSRYWGVVPHQNVFGRVVYLIAPNGVRRPR